MYQISIPTKICFGREIIEESIKENKGLFNGKLMVVSTGGTLRKNGCIDQLVELIKNNTSAKDIYVYERITANPKLTEIQGAVEFASQNDISGIIGFGGGSSIDAAKAIAASTGMRIPIKQIFEKGIEPDNRTLPIIAIPTTAGTGSELSKAAILNDADDYKKGGIRGVHLYPKLALVDSKYTEQIPKKITMETGFDVLAHAVESFVSKAASPYTRMLSEYAMRESYRSLLRLNEDLSDVDAREKLSYCSMIMGINLGNASTALPHRLQYPIGANTKTSHGAGLAAIYSSWIFYEYMENPDDMKKIFSILNVSEPKSAEEAECWMRNYIEGVGLPSTLSDLDISTVEIIEKMSNEVSGKLDNDPAFNVNDIVKQIYKKSI